MVFHAIRTPETSAYWRDAMPDDAAGLDDIQAKPFRFGDDFIRFRPRIEPEFIATLLCCQICSGCWTRR